MLRSTIGMLFSNDVGKSWNWVCERAIGYGGIWDPPIAVFASGTVMAGTIDGLALSPDHGCAWAFVKGPLEGRAIIDVVVRPEAPNQGFVLASASRGEDDAGASLFVTEIFETTDAGQNWAARASDFEPAFVAQTIEVARSDASRVYVSGNIGDQGVVLVSTDGAKSFVKYSFALERPNERAPFIAAVAPADPNRVYVRTGGATSRLLVSDDGAQTFRSVYAGPPLPGFALSPDGARVWLGSADGLFAASSTELAFAKVSDAPVQCLMAAEATLYACAGSTALPYVLAASTDLGKTFAPVLTWSALRGPLACPAESAASSCAAEWPAVRASLDPVAVLDGGIDGGARSDAPPSARLSAGGGCNASGSVIGGSLAAMAAALGLAIARRARRSSDRSR